MSRNTPEVFRPTADPSIPTMDLDQAAAFCRGLGMDLVTVRTLRTAIYRRELRRHLLSNRVRLSEDDIRTWIASTADAEFLDRAGNKSGSVA